MLHLGKSCVNSRSALAGPKYGFLRILNPGPTAPYFLRQAKPLNEVN